MKMFKTGRAAGGSLRGQFFLWGAFLICLLFFLGFIGMKGTFVTTETQDMEFFFGNIEKELPKALNLGLNGSGAVNTLVNFSRFLESSMGERYIDMKLLWLFTEASGTDVNITVGNFLGADETIGLNLSGSFKNLTVPYNSTNSTVFSLVSQTFNLTVSFAGHRKTVGMVRDKVNLYGFINLSRGKEFVQGDISG
jgi:hypothetical protein